MMRKALAAARVVGAVVAVWGSATVLGAGSAAAAPSDCTVTRHPVGATALCHDDSPPGREYALIVECFGLHGVPNAFPLMAVGPYQGPWSGSFAPSGSGQASCVGPTSIGTAVHAYVTIYRE